jgi:multidrug efflux pump subunit AcrA (membrane-fusion protein)
VVPAAQVEVRAPYEGVIATRPKAVGAAVVAGEAVAVLDGTELAMERDRARARGAAISHRAAAAKAELRLLEQRGEQLRGGVEKRATAVFEVTQNRHQVEASNARVKALDEERREAEIEVRVLEHQLAKYECASPLSGEIREARRGPGEMVRAGETIAVVQSRRRLVRVNVPSDRAERADGLAFALAEGGKTTALKVSQTCREFNLNGGKGMTLEVPDGCELAVGRIVDVEVIAR